MEKIVRTDEEWRNLLTPEQFQITRRKSTERSCSGPYWNHHESGAYACVCCGLELFKSDAKFDSKTGWPSFWMPADPSYIREEADDSFGMRRTEVLCARCDAHLGHIFEDGPKSRSPVIKGDETVPVGQPTGLRYCINSLALKFVPKKPAKS